MLETLRRSHNSDQIVLNEFFQCDIAWFNVFLDKFNGKIIIYNQGSPQVHVFVDTPLLGVGLFEVRGSTLPHIHWDSLQICPLSI